MSFSGIYAEATIQSLPDSELNQIPLFIDGADFDAAWWDSCNVDDGLYGRASIGGVTEIPIHFTEIERASNTCKIRINRGSVPTTGTLGVRIYPPNTSNPQYSPSDPYGSEAVYKSGLYYFPFGGGDDVSGSGLTLTSNGSVVAGNTDTGYGKGTKYNGTDQFFSGSAPILSAPFTMISLSKLESTSAQRGMVSLGNLSVSDNFYALISSGSSTRFWARDGGFIFVDSGNNVDTLGYYQFASRELGSSREGYLNADSANKGVGGATVSASGIDTLTIGTTADSTPFPNDGTQTHVWLANSDLGEDWLLYESEMLLTGIWGTWTTTTPPTDKADPVGIVLSSIILGQTSASQNSEVYSYSQINEGFAGYYNFVADPNVRRFGTNAVWQCDIVGTEAVLKCLGGTDPFQVFVDGVYSRPTFSGGQITLFSGLSDAKHSVSLFVHPFYLNNNGIDVIESQVLEVYGSHPAITPLMFDYTSDPASNVLNSYSTAIRDNLDLTPTYEQVEPWSYERGQTIFQATCDELWIYTDSTSIQFSIDGADATQVDFSESNDPSGAGTQRRAVNISNSLDNTKDHMYTIWDTVEESYGTQGVLCLNDGVQTAISPISIDFKKTLVLGASVIAGVVGNIQGFADTWLFSQDIRLLSTKAGLGGNTTGETIEDFPSIIESNGVPDVAIFGASTNDSGDSGIQAKYEALINDLISVGISTIICRGVVPYNATLNTSLSAAVIAVDNSSVYYVESQDWTPIDYQDGVHPSVLGYQQLTAFETPEFDDIINAGASPNNIILASIILEETSVSAKVYTNDLVLSSIILGQAVLVVPAIPEDLILSSIILNQTKRTGLITGVVEISMGMSIPRISMEMET